MVVVTIGTPPDAPRPGLAGGVETRLATQRGIEVDVQVLYLDIEHSQ
jgi:hypothetical protein